MTTPDFRGQRVLSLESRRETEAATLIARYGGTPIVAPALREVPLAANTAALDFAAALLLGEIDLGIFLTGVGVRAIVEVFEHAHPGSEIRDALSRIKVAVRGPKPAAVFREMGVPVWATAPEPNTWRELLAAIDARAADLPLDGARVAVQEYGVPNPQLVDALIARGAAVMAVPVYRWALPDDLDRLRAAVAAVAGRGIDVLLLTTGVQLAHLCEVADQLGCTPQFRTGLASTFIASIGPTCSEEVARRGLTAHMQASHPKLGFLVREAAERSATFARDRRWPA